VTVVTQMFNKLCPTSSTTRTPYKTDPKATYPTKSLANDRTSSGDNSNITVVVVVVVVVVVALAN
jgi:hypothetical protein